MKVSLPKSDDKQSYTFARTGKWKLQYWQTISSDPQSNIVLKFPRSGVQKTARVAFTRSDQLLLIPSTYRHLGQASFRLEFPATILLRRFSPATWQRPGPAPFGIAREFCLQETAWALKEIASRTFGELRALLQRGKSQNIKKKNKSA